MNNEVSVILTKLRTEGSIKSFDDARSITANIEDASMELPRVLYHPLKEEANPNRLATEAVSQVTTVYFVLVSVCPSELLEATRNAILANLVGKIFGGAVGVSEVNHVEGEVLEVSATAVWWRDVFSYRLERRVL